MKTVIVLGYNSFLIVVALKYIVERVAITSDALNKRKTFLAQAALFCHVFILAKFLNIVQFPSGVDFLLNIIPLYVIYGVYLPFYLACRKERNRLKRFQSFRF